MGLGLLDNQSKPIDHQYLGMAYAVTLRQLPQIEAGVQVSVGSVRMQEAMCCR